MFGGLALVMLSFMTAPAQKKETQLILCAIIEMIPREVTFP